MHGLDSVYSEVNEELSIFPGLTVYRQYALRVHVGFVAPEQFNDRPVEHYFTDFTD